MFPCDFPIESSHSFPTDRQKVSEDNRKQILTAPTQSILLILSQDMHLIMID